MGADSRCSVASFASFASGASVYEDALSVYEDALSSPDEGEESVGPSKRSKNCIWHVFLSAVELIYSCTGSYGSARNRAMRTERSSSSLKKKAEAQAAFDDLPAPPPSQKPVGAFLSGLMETAALKGSFQDATYPLVRDDAAPVEPNIFPDSTSPRPTSSSSAPTSSIPPSTIIPLRRYSALPASRPRSSPPGSTPSTMRRNSTQTVARGSWQLKPLVLTPARTITTPLTASFPSSPTLGRRSYSSLGSLSLDHQRPSSPMSNGTRPLSRPLSPLGMSAVHRPMRYSDGSVAPHRDSSSSASGYTYRTYVRTRSPSEDMGQTMGESPDSSLHGGSEGEKDRSVEGSPSEKEWEEGRKSNSLKVVEEGLPLTSWDEVRDDANSARDEVRDEANNEGQREDDDEDVAHDRTETDSQLDWLQSLLPPAIRLSQPSPSSSAFVLSTQQQRDENRAVADEATPPSPPPTIPIPSLPSAISDNPSPSNSVNHSSSQTPSEEPVSTDVASATAAAEKRDRRRQGMRGPSIDVPPSPTHFVSAHPAVNLPLAPIDLPPASAPAPRSKSPPAKELAVAVAEPSPTSPPRLVGIESHLPTPPAVVPRHALHTDYPSTIPEHREASPPLEAQALLSRITISPHPPEEPYPIRDTPSFDGNSAGAPVFGRSASTSSGLDGRSSSFSHYKNGVVREARDPRTCIDRPDPIMRELLNSSPPRREVVDSPPAPPPETPTSSGRTSMSSASTSRPPSSLGSTPKKRGSKLASRLSAFLAGKPRSESPARPERPALQPTSILREAGTSSMSSSSSVPSLRYSQPPVQIVPPPTRFDGAGAGVEGDGDDLDRKRQSVSSSYSAAVPRPPPKPYQLPPGLSARPIQLPPGLAGEAEGRPSMSSMSMSSRSPSPNLPRPRSRTQHASVRTTNSSSVDAESLYRRPPSPVRSIPASPSPTPASPTLGYHQYSHRAPSPRSRPESVTSERPRRRAQKPAPRAIEIPQRLSSIPAGGHQPISFDYNPPVRADGRRVTYAASPGKVRPPPSDTQSVRDVFRSQFMER